MRSGLVMDVKEVMFSVNDYDQDGDVAEKGVFLHLGALRVKVADDLNGFKAVSKRISGMVDEIADNYPNLEGCREHELLRHLAFVDEAARVEKDSGGKVI